jgi:hypothetical protein
LRYHGLVDARAGIDEVRASRRRVQRGVRSAVLAAMAAIWAAPMDADANPRRDDREEHEDPGPITDPNDAPFMQPPNGQLRTWSAGEPEPFTRGFSSRRRLQLTVLPAYAAIRMPFLGRPGSGCAGGLDCTPIRGGGASVEVDVRLIRWLWLRLGVAHTVHPVDDNYFEDEEEGTVEQVANAGAIHATSFGLSGVYPIDLGRFLPLLDFGAGAMVLNSPKAAISGQMGGACREDNVCDTGLSCGADQVCRPTLIPEAHVGVGVDVLLGQHWSAGLQIRYYALLSQISVFPTYLVGAVRLAARF